MESVATDAGGVAGFFVSSAPASGVRLRAAVTAAAFEWIGTVGSPGGVALVVGRLISAAGRGGGSTSRAAGISGVGLGLTVNGNGAGRKSFSSFAGCGNSTGFVLTGGGASSGSFISAGLGSGADGGSSGIVVAGFGGNGSDGIGGLTALTGDI